MTTKLERFSYSSHREPLRESIEAAKKANVCFGCGAAFKMGRSSGSPYAAPVELGGDMPDPLVCARQHGYAAYKACAEKARKRAPCCPGCGALLGDHLEKLQLCEACQKLLDLGDRVKDEKLTSVEFRGWMIGPRMNDEEEDRELRDEFVVLLAKAVSRTGKVRTSYHGTDPSTTVTVAQAEAITKMKEKLDHLMTLQRELGRQEGGNLLVRLARGEMTPQEWRKLEDESTEVARGERELEKGR